MLRAHADVGVRWLLKAHPAAGLFVAQVGDQRDHDLGFRDPAADDGSGTPGIAIRSAYPNIGGDLGGKAALALALAAERAPADVAPSLLGAAREWYAAGAASGGVAPRLGGDFYDGDTFEDALAAGAAALYRVTGERPYLDDALRYLAAIEPDGRLSWNALAGFAAADLCGALGAPAVADATARDTACAALRAQGRAAVERASANGPFRTPGAFGWGRRARTAAPVRSPRSPAARLASPAARRLRPRRGTGCWAATRGAPASSSATGRRRRASRTTGRRSAVPERRAERSSAGRRRCRRSPRRRSAERAAARSARRR